MSVLNLGLENVALVHRSLPEWTKKELTSTGSINNVHQLERKWKKMREQLKEVDNRRTRE
eukprot:15351430-Ditylum_brightwellii.AAC.2